MTKPTGMSWCHSVPQGEVLIVLFKSEQKHTIQMKSVCRAKQMAVFMLAFREMKEIGLFLFLKHSCR